MFKYVIFAALLAFAAAKPVVIETVDYPVEYSSPISVEYSPLHYSDYVYDSHHYYDYYPYAYPYSYYFR